MSNFLIGYQIGLGVVAAAVTGLLLLGLLDWAKGWLGYLINMIRLARGREKPTL